MCLRGLLLGLALLFCVTKDNNGLTTEKRRLSSIVSTADHNTPIKDWDQGIQDPISRLQVETLDRTATSKAVQAATGDLTDVHDYVIAATQAQVATELTTTVRNKALEAFNDIMRMPL